MVGPLSAVFFEPSPAHPDGPHLVVEIGHKTVNSLRYVATLKASDGEVTGRIDPSGVTNFIGPADHNNKHMLTVSNDGNSFYYFTRYNSGTNGYSQVQKYDHSFA